MTVVASSLRGLAFVVVWLRKKILGIAHESCPRPFNFVGFRHFVPGVM